MLKTLSAVIVLITLSILSGCAIVPAYPAYGGPGYYTPAPYYSGYYGYGRGYGYGHGHGHWR